jgi:hypothetical protein
MRTLKYGRSLAGRIQHDRIALQDNCSADFFFICFGRQSRRYEIERLEAKSFGENKEKLPEYPAPQLGK